MQFPPHKQKRHCTQGKITFWVSDNKVASSWHICAGTTCIAMLYENLDFISDLMVMRVAQSSSRNFLFAPVSKQPVFTNKEKQQQQLF